MNKKAVSLPLNTIIIATIGILVLVIVLLFFSNKFGLFGKGISDCSSGFTRPTRSECSEIGYPVHIPMEEEGGKITKYCCQSVGS